MGVAEPDLDRLVAGIHERSTRNPRACALAIGGYLLVELFGHKAGLADETHRGWVVFQRLARRTDLPVTPKWAKEAMWVTAVFEALPAETRDPLTLAHLRVLRTVQNPSQREQLAREAVGVGFSAAELSNRVRSVCGARPNGRGRPAKSPVSKVFRELHRAADDLVELSAGGEPVTAKEVEAIRKKLRAVRVRT